VLAGAALGAIVSDRFVADVSRVAGAAGQDTGAMP